MRRFWLTMVCMGLSVSVSLGEQLTVPNASFELPGTTYFEFEIDNWEDPGSTGVFANTAGFGNFIVNADGDQLAFMNCDAANTDNNIFVDLPYALSAGEYTLTVGVAARSDSFPSDPANTKMELRLFTRTPDPEILASTEVVYSALSNSELTYYSATFNTADIGLELLGGTIGIWLDCTEGSSGGDWTMDDVTLTRIPMTVTNPAPFDGKDGVGTANGNKVDVDLSWNTATDIEGIVNGAVTGHYLYLVSDEPNFVDVTPVTISAGTPVSETASYSITLDMDKTYYWRVDESISNSSPEDAVTITGPVWSFETLKSIPVITTDPQSQQVEAGSSVEFFVEVISLSPMTYKWYVSVDNSTETDDDDTWLGSDSDTLRLTTVQEANEGYYYCVVENESGTTVPSKTAYLAISRKVAWYQFEGDLTDSAGDNDGVGIRTDPNAPYVYIDEGMVGKAISLNGVDEAVQIPRSVQDSFTIALWVQTEALGGTGGWWTGRGLVDGDMPSNQNDFGMVVSAGRLGFGVGPENVTIVSQSLINDGLWHYCVVTRDHLSGEMRVYVDGELETETVGPVGRKDAADTLRIGKILSGTNYLNGKFDEVELYNYKLSELDIAKLYSGITQESVCLRSAQASLDLNDDCKVDLGDFALLVSQWMDCALVPDCIE